MRRRALLTAVGAGLTGCVGSGDDPTPTPASVPTVDPNTEQPPDTLGPTLPFDPASADRSACRAVPDDHVCYGRDNHPTRLVPESRTVTHGSPVRFGLLNRSDTVVRFSPYKWRLSKLVDGSWVQIGPTLAPDPLTSLDTGQSHVYTLTTSADTAVDDRARVSDRRITVDGLGGGTYAFSVVDLIEVADRTATFELDEPPLALTHREALTVTDDGDTVRAELPHGEHTETVTVTLVDDATDPERHCVESLLWRPLLRDAIALLGDRDADKAVVAGPSDLESTADPVEAYTVRFQGVTYAVRSVADTGRRESG